MKLLRIVIIALIVIAAGAFIWITAGSDPETLLLHRLNLADQHLVLLVLLLSALTLLSTLTGLPVFYISLALGFLLGFLPALLLSWVVNILAVMATFFMVRHAFSDYFQGKYGKKKILKRINKRIGKYGFWTVVFSRGIYIIPTNLINFSFPLSNISPRAYLLGTSLGLIPECLINVLSGYLVKHEIILLSSSPTQTWRVLVIGAFIVLAVFLLLLLNVLRKRKNLEP